jgi:serpin B
VSRESEKLYEAIGQIRDMQIEEAQSRPRQRVRWAAPLAAVIALAALLTVFFSGRGNTAYAVAEAKYPTGKMAEQGPLPHTDELEGFIRAALPRLLSGEKGENRACSPLNIYLALSMLAEAAGGESRAQLLELLDSPDIETQRQRAKKLWEQSYYEGENEACRLASSLWLDAGMKYDPSTVKTLAEEYYASVFRGDMGSAEYDKLLQDWLNEQTGGLLEEQAGSAHLGPDVKLALAAAIWFKGEWIWHYSSAQTEPETFHRPEGDVTCDFMHGGWPEGDYYWGEGFTAVPQRFVNGRSMLYILPEEGRSPEELLSDGGFLDFLTADHRSWEGRETVIVDIRLPKFDIMSQLDLIPALKELGVTDILDPEKADFSPMGKLSSAAVAQAGHTARVKVDEEGCEAAAFTTIAVPSSLPREQPRIVEFVLDRPFIFVILGRDDLPLFVGIVNDPAA